MSRGASSSISLNGYFNIFVLFIVFRASSEYISERLDGSTCFQFTRSVGSDFSTIAILPLQLKRT